MPASATHISRNQLGRFFTTNCDHILQGLEKYVKGKKIADPFAGGRDLLNWARKHNAESTVGFDIDKTLAEDETVFYGDSLLEHRHYDFVLTNPPYLYVNKADDKTKRKYFDKSTFVDLYQISLFGIMDSNEGILIVPVNFLSAENSREIRKIFFAKFRVVQMNYFKHQVFADTSYSVISFYYKLKEPFFENRFEIETHIFPGGRETLIELEKEHDWTIGGGFLKKIKDQSNRLGVFRLTENDIRRGDIEIPAVFGHLKNRRNIKVDEETYKTIKSNILLLKAIDTGTKEGKICLENIKRYGVECLVSKATSRNQIYLVFRNRISLKEQKRLIELFNNKIEQMRNKYLSLFMTNYRDNGRKRISFGFAYKLINYLYYTNHTN
jgi:hypothetical protein